jgi:hypothetical protein
MFNNVLFYFFGNRTVYEITWKNTAQPDRTQTTRRMRFAHWIPKSTYTHSEYVMFTAFPLQQWFHERPSMLRYTVLFRIIRCYIIASA